MEKRQLSRLEQDERKKLSILLHDHIQPLVVGARMHVWEIQRNPGDPDGIEKTAEKLESALTDVLENLRSLSVELSPAALQNNGLSGGLNWLTTYMRDSFDFSVNLYLDDALDPVREETAFLLFEGVKELLLNAAKHSGRDRADLTGCRTVQDWIRITVADQGKGFDPEVIGDADSDTQTLGFFSIRERLSSIGGNMTVDTGKNQGTRITLTAPAGLPENP